MNKCILFLINGLGIEKRGSYSISIDQCMPRLSRIKETSFFTTAVTSSLEYREAYQRFFLGDTNNIEFDYIKNNIVNDSIVNNPSYQSISNLLKSNDGKFHIFIEPTSEGIIEEVNEFLSKFDLSNKKVYLHLLLTQQTTSDYNNIIKMTNYIKYHIFNNVSIGFIIGKEYFSENLDRKELDFNKKMFFYCSCERWTDTEKKFNFLRDSNVKPSMVEGFCVTNECFFTKDDVLMFFNTKRTTYDKFIDGFYYNWKEVFKVDNPVIPIFSLIQLDSKRNIPYFSESIGYEYSLANLLTKFNKKALIVSDEKNISLVNFLANGLVYKNSPNISFMKIVDGYYEDMNNIVNIIENGGYDLIIFDYHMDVSKTINDLKNQLSHIDVVLGNIGGVCQNKYSLIISSLYGLKKTLPLADYNSELVTIDYEMQIPIFFFDYRYPRSKYVLVPGETNYILNTCISLIEPNCGLYSLVRTKGLLNNLFGKK